MRRRPNEGRASYNARTVAKLEQWIKNCSFKPIHICILERVFASAWREKDTSALAADIRRDRDARWWATISALPQSERSHEQVMHRRSGPPEDADRLFVMSWGEDWRRRLEATPTKQDWLQGRGAFVKQTCRDVGLRHGQIDATGRVDETDELNGRSKYDGRHTDDLQLPTPLRRDELWDKNMDTMQLEFVVDNQLVAALANMEARCTNDFYRPVVLRIRSRIRRLMQHSFACKAVFLQPVDWRPREFNKAATWWQTMY